MANAASLHLDAHLSRVRLRNLALNDLEIRAGFGDLRNFHVRHLYGYNRRSAGCHKSSYDSWGYGCVHLRFCFSLKVRIG